MKVGTGLEHRVQDGLDVLPLVVGRDQYERSYVG
jgi:hypothetical protein